jgi:hypothetical protein
MKAVLKTQDSEPDGTRGIDLAGRAFLPFSRLAERTIPETPVGHRLRPCVGNTDKGIGLSGLCLWGVGR